jgi:hypothetical protein
MTSFVSQRQSGNRTLWSQRCQEFGDRGSVHAQVHGLRKFVKEGLRDIRELIVGKHGNPVAVRREFARHIESITLSPEADGREVHYRGSWKLLGDRDGAEGQNRTGYAGLFRAALYQ